MQEWVRYTRSARLALAVLAIATAAGCWEKIEYTGSHSKTPQSSKAEPPLVAPGDKPKVAVETALPPTAHVSPSVEATNTTPVVAAPTPPPIASHANAVTGNADDRYPVAPTSPSASDAPSTSPKPTEAASVPAVSIPKPNDDNRYPAPSSGTALDARLSEAKPEVPSARTNAPTTQAATATPLQVASSTETTAAPTSAPLSAMSTKRAAWLLGSRLSLAALANDRGIAAKNVPGWFSEAQQAGRMLKSSIPDLPSPAVSGDTDPASKQVMNYLLVNGQRIGHDLTKQYGAAEAALFEVALKSNLLLLIYRPGTMEVDSVSAAIQESAARAKLPEKLWTPLIDAINSQAPPKEVQADIRKLHGDVDQYLAGAAGPSGK